MNAVGPRRLASDSRMTNPFSLDKFDSPFRMELKVICSGQSHTPKFQPDSQRWSRKSVAVSRSVFSMPLLGSNLASRAVSGPLLVCTIKRNEK